MKLLIQRVSEAQVNVEGKTVGSIKKGLLILIGVSHTDTQAEIEWLVNKVINLRIFNDAAGKINESLLDCKGEALVVSQFTLYADCNSGRRPSFINAAPPQLANELYEIFSDELRKAGINVQNGEFGADMKVSLVNDGPVTVMLERDKKTA